MYTVACSPLADRPKTTSLIAQPPRTKSIHHHMQIPASEPAAQELASVQQARAAWAPYESLTPTS